MNKSAFYTKVRSTVFGGALKAEQVEGLELILAEADRRGTNTEYLAYILATAAWETAFTIQPVREAYWVKNAETWRKKNLRYWPFYGRGYVQLTWEFNYAKATEYFVKTLGINVDFVKNPDLVMVPAYSIIILFEGMEKGWFTTKSLANYLDGIDEGDAVDLAEFTKARRIVNGTDKDDEIAALAIKFEKALRGALRAENGSPVVAEPKAPDTTPAPLPASPVAPTAPVKNTDPLTRILRLLGSLLASYFKR